MGIGCQREGEVTPCFTVNADCTLMINGDLQVGCQIVEGPIQPDLDNPEFRDAIEERWLQGIG